MFAGGLAGLQMQHMLKATEEPREERERAALLPNSSPKKA
jgi:hypothetical protein